MRVLLRAIAVWTGVHVVLFGLFLIGHLRIVLNPPGRELAGGIVLLAAGAASVGLGAYAMVELWGLHRRGWHLTSAFFGVAFAVLGGARLLQRGAGPPLTAVLAPAIVLALLLNPWARATANRQ